MSSESSPIILLGMHRSGTTVVAKIVSELGVDMGRYKDVNHEPRFYIALNNWILRQAGTTWQHPNSFERLIENSDAFDAVEGIVRKAVNRLMIKVVHPTRFLNVKNGNWGWKDPRTTITLPIWLKIYPNAKLIYVHRHGVPVASSLVVRKRRSIPLNFKWWHKLFTPIKPGPALGTRNWTLDDGVDLWDEYCSIAERNLSNVEDKRILRISYENLLATPEPIIEEIGRFLNIQCDSRMISDAVDLVVIKDPYSFRSNPELVNLEKASDGILSRHGYKV